MIIRYYSEIIIVMLLALLFVLSPGKAKAESYVQSNILCATIAPECNAAGEPLDIDGNPMSQDGPCYQNYKDTCAAQQKQEVNAELESCNFSVEYLSNESTILQHDIMKKDKEILKLRRIIRRLKGKN